MFSTCEWSFFNVEWWIWYSLEMTFHHSQMYNNSKGYCWCLSASRLSLEKRAKTRFGSTVGYQWSKAFVWNTWLILNLWNPVKAVRLYIVFHDQEGLLYFPVTVFNHDYFAQILAFMFALHCNGSCSAIKIQNIT